jgi:hypothetical protein
MIDYQTLKHENARVAAYLAAPRTTSRIPVGSRCMASLPYPAPGDPYNLKRVSVKLWGISSNGKEEVLLLSKHGKNYSLTES